METLLGGHGVDLGLAGVGRVPVSELFHDRCALGGHRRVVAGDVAQRTAGQLQHQLRLLVEPDRIDSAG